MSDTETIPRTLYTKSGDVTIAYQVLGDGPIDIVYAPGWISNVNTDGRTRILRASSSD